MTHVAPTQITLYTHEFPGSALVIKINSCQSYAFIILPNPLLPLTYAKQNFRPKVQPNTETVSMQNPTSVFTHHHKSNQTWVDSAKISDRMNLISFSHSFFPFTAVFCPVIFSLFSTMQMY